MEEVCIFSAVKMQEKVIDAMKCTIFLIPSEVYIYFWFFPAH